MARVVRELLEAFLLALIVFFVIQGSVRNFRVEGRSMDPTIEHGQYLLVNKLVYFKTDVQRLSRIIPFWKVDQPSGDFAIHPPERGEVIVFRSPPDRSRDFVKRVIGLPGDVVELRDGNVYINGELLDEPYLDPQDVSNTFPSGSTQKARWTIGEKEYFVLGDNRDNSNDSREFGPFPEEDVLGKVWFVYWPLSDLHLLDSFSSHAQGALRQIPWP